MNYRLLTYCINHSQLLYDASSLWHLIILDRKNENNFMLCHSAKGYLTSMVGINKSCFFSMVRNRFTDKKSKITFIKLN